MKIPANIKKDVPHLESLFQKIEEFSKRLESARKKTVAVAGNPLTPKIVWKYQMYEQFIIHRSCDLIEASLDAWRKRKPTIAFLATRGLIETAAMFFYVIKQLENLLEEKDFQKIDHLIMESIFSTRLENYLPHKSKNILTIIDKVDKDSKGIRKTYDSLCEFAHPNSDALLMLYGEIREDYSCEISSQNGYNRSIIESGISGIAATLGLLVIALQNLADLYTPLHEVALSYEANKR